MDYKRYHETEGFVARIERNVPYGNYAVILTREFNYCFEQIRGAQHYEWCEKLIGKFANIKVDLEKISLNDFPPHSMRHRAMIIHEIRKMTKDKYGNLTNKEMKFIEHEKSIYYEGFCLMEPWCREDAFCHGNKRFIFSRDVGPVHIDERTYRRLEKHGHKIVRCLLEIWGPPMNSRKYGWMLASLCVDEKVDVWLRRKVSRFYQITNQMDEYYREDLERQDSETERDEEAEENQIEEGAERAAVRLLL